MHFVVSWTVLHAKLDFVIRKDSFPKILCNQFLDFKLHKTVQAPGQFQLKLKWKQARKKKMKTRFYWFLWHIEKRSEI